MAVSVSHHHHRAAEISERGRRIAYVCPKSTVRSLACAAGALATAGTGCFGSRLPLESSCCEVALRTHSFATVEPHRLSGPIDLFSRPYHFLKRAGRESCS